MFVWYGKTKMIWPADGEKSLRTVLLVLMHSITWKKLRFMIAMLKAVTVQHLVNHINFPTRFILPRVEKYHIVEKYQNIITE